MLLGVYFFAWLNRNAPTLLSSDQAAVANYLKGE